LEFERLHVSVELAVPRPDRVGLDPVEAEGLVEREREVPAHLEGEAAGREIARGQDLVPRRVEADVVPPDADEPRVDQDVLEISLPKVVTPVEVGADVEPCALSPLKTMSKALSPSVTPVPPPFVKIELRW
jgi:hypothetical protein